MRNGAMSLRFKLLAALYVAVVLISLEGNFGLTDSVFDIFIWLGALLALSLIVLWPSSSRTDRVDRAVDGRSWADRIDIELAARAHQNKDI
jgi:hypothetical protein